MDLNDVLQALIGNNQPQPGGMLGTVLQQLNPMGSAQAAEFPQIIHGTGRTVMGEQRGPVPPYNVTTGGDPNVQHMEWWDYFKNYGRGSDQARFSLPPSSEGTANYNLPPNIETRRRFTDPYRMAVQVQQARMRADAQSRLAAATGGDMMPAPDPNMPNPAGLLGLPSASDQILAAAQAEDQARQSGQGLLAQILAAGGSPFAGGFQPR